MRGVALILLAAMPLGARWWKAEEPMRAVVSEAGEKQAREVLAGLEVAHRVFSQLLPRGKHAPLPVVAYQLSGARFRAVRTNEETAGFYQGGPDRDSIVLEIGRPGRILFHEYTHLALHHGTGPLPSWLEEGLAEFYSTVAVAGVRVRVGAPIPEHLSQLLVTAWMNAADLSRARTGDRHGTPTPVFYSQAWALVHMLRMHERYRARFGDLLNALANGEPQAQAFQRIYGRGLAEALVDLKDYLARGRLPVMEVGIPPAEGSGSVRSAPLADADGEMEFSRLALQAGRGAAGDGLYRKLSGLNNPTAREKEMLGLLALERRDRAAAVAHLRGAIAMPEAGAVSFFEYAMLLREEPPAEMGKAEVQAEVARLLGEAVRRNPEYAEALFLLGTFAANGGRHTEAVGYFQRAVAVLPRQAFFWHAMAVSYHALRDMDNSRRAAQRALDSAGTAEQVEMARAALRLSEPAPVVGPATAARVEREREVARVEGVLERVDCLGKPARLHVRVNGQRKAFWVEDPGAVLLKNFSSATFEFRCGTIPPVPIVVEYKPQVDTERLTLGFVTGMEFR